MTKKSRYLLLFACFVLFLIIAPLIVLYVRGQAYDFASGKFVSTGIFAIRSEPKDVNIFIDDKQKRTSAGDINFMLPGEYKLSLKKDGYMDWNKRLVIQEGQVTWANPGAGKIYLLKASPKISTLSENVLDFFSKDNTLLFINEQRLTYSTGNPIQESDAYSLPKPVSQILGNYKEKNFLLTDGSTTSTPALLIFNANDGSFTDLTGLFKTLPQLQFSGNGDLYALDNNILYKIDTLQKTKLDTLDNISAFYFQGDNLYYIKQKDAPSSIYMSQSPFSQSQVLANELPSFSKAQLLVTFEKQIFLIADGSLYKVNSAMEKITDNLNEIDFDPLNSSLLITHLGQFDYYNFSSQDLNFVTRSSEPLKNLSVKNNIGYAFFSNNSGVNVIELDDRGSQNQYTLYQSQNVRKFFVDSSGQTITLLDSGLLKTLVIR